jgi:hypothetical protein
MALIKIGIKIGAGAGVLMLAGSLAVTPLAALTMRECSTAYKAAQKSGTLGGMDWQKFRKARCGPGPSPGAAPDPSPGAAAPSPGPALPGGSAYLPGAVFPSRVAPKYGDETPGKGRRYTCLDQYRLNKVGNANGGLKWVQKGGGYYSECNMRLKAAR